MTQTTQIDPLVAKHRTADADIDAQFLNRWSPRSYDLKKKVADKDLKAVLEAARWAPSSYNEQPWRFVVARSDADRKKLLGTMIEFNQSWAKSALVLILGCAMTNFSQNGKQNRHAFHDLGAAWENLSLEATRRGLHTHGMAGFDPEKAKQTLGLPADAAAVIMFALGYAAPADKLPADLQKMEVPNTRRPVSESCFEGTWGKKLAF